MLFLSFDQLPRKAEKYHEMRIIPDLLEYFKLSKLIKSKNFGSRFLKLLFTRCLNTGLSKNPGHLRPYLIEKRHSHTSIEKTLTVNGDKIVLI